MWEKLFEAQQAINRGLSRYRPTHYNLELDLTEAAIALNEWGGIEL